jgi:hypothetical protein
MTSRPIITPGEFQEICDRAVLAVDLQCWNPEALPNDIAADLISEVHKGVCRQLGQRYEGENAVLPNERRIEDLVGLVSRHWSGPILVERTVYETIRMVLEHWRERHDLQ